MAISFSCPRCGKKLKAPDSAAGKSSKCPGCGSPVTCPEPVYDAELVNAPPGGLDPFADLDTDKPYEMAAPAAGMPGPAEASAGEARRPCPMCGEMIVATAAKCRYCGEIFDPALKKAKKKKQKGRGGDDENLSTGDTAPRGALLGDRLYHRDRLDDPGQAQGREDGSASPSSWASSGMSSGRSSAGLASGAGRHEDHVPMHRLRQAPQGAPGLGGPDEEVSGVRDPGDLPRAGPRGRAP